MRATSIDAFFLVDKPAGMSSHDVVALARRALGTRKVGHGGTLDPFATGLLVLLAGRGTRLLQFVPSEPKVYEATIAFGAETETDDGTGRVVREAALPSQEDVRAAIPRLTGALDQLPPAYSAKHVNGERAYAIARRGETPDLVTARVQVERWEILEQSDDRLVARIACGTGTYIRSLARDLGRLVHSAAHLTALRRVRVGPFDVAEADDVESWRNGVVRSRDLGASLGDMPRVILEDEEVRRVRHGMRIHAGGEAGRAALVDRQGALVAVANRDDGAWRPAVVLATE